MKELARLKLERESICRTDSIEDTGKSQDQSHRSWQGLSLTLSALIKAAAAKIGQAHPAENVKYV
jgi:hypothetical protein